MKYKRVLSIIILILIIAADGFVNVVQAAKYEKDTGVSEEYLKTDAKVPKISAEAAILMDARTGEILFQKNATKKEYPASTTKCMTSLVAIENNNLNDIMEYSENAIFSIEPGSSNAAIDVGEKLTVDQSLYGAMLESANECCNALAEKTAGSIEGFVDMMNQKAQAIGCVNTHFNNANGLYEKEHYTCVYDMALIAKEGMKNPDWRRYSGTVYYQGAPKNKKKEKRYWINHHKMLNGSIPYNNTLYTVEGGKTGYTDMCKNTLVTYAKSNSDDLELICVVMRSNKYYYVNGHNVAYTYQDTQNLFDWGFSNFSTVTSALETGQNQLDQSNYFYQTYTMLQPERFVDFKAENECKVSVSNSYDATKMMGTLQLDIDNNTGKWGTYQYLSSGRVIASTDVYYVQNKDVLKSLYKKSKGIGAITRHINTKQYKFTLPKQIHADVEKIVFLAVAVLFIILLIILIVKIVSAISRRRAARAGFSMGYVGSRRTRRVKGRRRGYGSFASPRRSRRFGRSKVNYGYIDSSSRKRRKRYSKKNKLHF